MADEVSSGRVRDANEAKSPVGKKRSGGLSMPANPALALQELQMQQMRERPGSETTDNNTSHTVSQSADLLTYRPPRGRTDQPTDRPADRLPGHPTGRPADLRARVKALGETPMQPVTLKMPGGLNEYLDDYVHEHYKEKVKKQDLIRRAIELVIYELETGKPLVRLEKE